MPTNFKPRVITAEQAAKGYNNEGRGELIGYVAVPAEHEEACRYRISTGGNPDKKDRESCTCRIGLWHEAPKLKLKLKLKLKPKPKPKPKPRKKKRA